jgi:hypothetical protein
MNRMTKKHWLGTILTVLCLVVISVLAVAEFRHSNAAPVDLTGVWTCNDRGTYFIRQIGNDVWWFGRGSDWANVYRGKMTVGGTLGTTVFVIGEWADVPTPGITASANGQLDLIVRSASRFERAGVTGGFGGSVCTRQ